MLGFFIATDGKTEARKFKYHLQNHSSEMQIEVKPQSLFLYRSTLWKSRIELGPYVILRLLWSE